MGDGNLGLTMDGLGQFGMPLSEPEILRIITACKQAPFGKGSEILVDTSVRNIWEIDAAQVQLRHPNWKRQENAALKYVCEQFGLPVEQVQAHLYKLLVYQPGAMFKPHQVRQRDLPSRAGIG